MIRLEHSGSAPATVAQRPRGTVATRLARPAICRYPAAMLPETIITDDHPGWARWRGAADDRFAELLGDFYFRPADDRRVECRMATGPEHANGHGYLHGGFLMSFIDMSMFAFIFPQLEKGGAVTLSCATDFLSPGIVGEPIEASGEILKETGKMLFVRGLVTQRGGTVCSFNGTMRKVPRVPREEPARVA